MIMYIKCQEEHVKFRTYQEMWMEETKEATGTKGKMFPTLGKGMFIVERETNKL